MKSLAFYPKVFPNNKIYAIGETGLDYHWDVTFKEEQKAAFKAVPIELKAGYATFHHPLMVHGSHENRSNRSRRAFVLNVFKEGTISNTDEELLQGVPVIAKGHKMEGQFFPLLFDPAE